MEKKRKNFKKKDYCLNYFPKVKSPWINYHDAHRNHSMDNGVGVLSFFHQVFHCDSYDYQNDHDNYVNVFVQRMNSTT